MEEYIYLVVADFIVIDEDDRTGSFPFAVVTKSSVPITSKEDLDRILDTAINEAREKRSELKKKNLMARIRSYQLISVDGLTPEEYIISSINKHMQTLIRSEIRALKEELKEELKH